MSVSLEVTPQPHVLTIAGSDSGGGAGVQADLKTIAAFGCYGSSVITGLTAQNTLGVHAVHEVPSDFVVKQLQSVFDDSPPVALKFGMLTSSSTVSAIANYLPVQKNRPVMVLDPVMISTSGHTLLADDAIQAIKDELLPLVDWITPNIPEAMCLLGHKQESISGGLESLLDMAKKLNDLPCEVVLLKGGHLRVSKAEVMALAGKYPVIWEQGDDEQETIEFLSRYRDGKGLRQETEFVVDILLQKSTGKMTLFVGRMLESRNTHGTGCTLSAAIASTLAKHKMANGDQPYDAVSICRTAIEYTRSAISSAFEFGQGHGPLNHSHLTAPRALPPPTKHNPHPFMSYLIQSDLPLWQSYVKHPFVVQLGDGTLPVECFEHYIKQDYHYLRHYARAHALGAYKSSSFEDISAFTGIAAHIARESQMHVDYCAEFGISLPQLMSTPESPACSAYARYILDIGAQGDVLDLYLAVASCLVGYGEVGLWLQKRVREGEAKMVGNRYKKWMEDYAGKEFLDAVDRGIDNLESRIALDPPSPAKLERLVGIWHNVVRLEKEFWDMGLSRT